MFLLLIWLATTSGSLAEKPYVEIDLSTLPTQRGNWRYKLIVHTTDKDYTFEDEVGVGSTGPGDLGTMAEILLMEMTEAKFKAEVIDKTKIRVYGRTYNGGFLPATEGKVESKDLKREELPKIKNPPKA